MGSQTRLVCVAVFGRCHAYKCFSPKDRSTSSYSRGHDWCRHVFLEQFNLVPEDCEVRARCLKSQAHADSDCRDLTVSAASVRCDVHPAKSGNFPPGRDFKSISNVEEVTLLEVDTVGDISNLEDVHPMKVDSALTQQIATNSNAV